jgi:glycosyltransferase involved in cell wall biosynthesis
MSLSSVRRDGADALAASLTAPAQATPARPGGIAIVLHDLRGGGAERACLRLARGMARASVAVDLVLVRGEGAYMGEVPSGVTLTVLDAPRVSRAILPLALHLRATRPRAVLSALTHMNLATIAAARLAGIGARVVVSERNQISAKAHAARGWWQRGLYRAVPMAYRLADKVIAVSEGVAGDLTRFGRLPEEKVGTIHNPVFEAGLDTLARAEPSHPWFTPGSPPVILGVGRLHHQKGFDVLLDAFAHARAQTDCRLVILGEGEARGRLQAQADALGLGYDIDMPGFCANPFALMARAGCFVLSSRWEGFPNALVEAMACGAPVVATDCPSGPREILGGIAPLVPVDDAPALGRALLATLAGKPPVTRMRARAQEFSIGAATARYLAVLEGE